MSVVLTGDAGQDLQPTSSDVPGKLLGTAAFWVKTRTMVPDDLALMYLHARAGNVMDIILDSVLNKITVSFGGRTDSAAVTWSAGTWNSLVVAYNRTGSVINLFWNGFKLITDGQGGTWSALGASSAVKVGSSAAETGGLDGRIGYLAYWNATVLGDPACVLLNTKTPNDPAIGSTPTSYWKLVSGTAKTLGTDAIGNPGSATFDDTDNPPLTDYVAPAAGLPFFQVGGAGVSSTAIGGVFGADSATSMSPRSSAVTIR